MKTEIKTITPSTAKEMLKRNNGNRNLSMAHVNFLTKEMLSGNWQFDGQPIRFTEGGTLLDGQHRLNAVIKSEIAQDFLIIRGIEKDAFKVMDTGKRRSSGDALSALGVAQPNNIAAAARMIIILERGFSSQNTNTQNKPSNTDVLEFYNRHPEIAVLVNEGGRLYVDFGKVLPISTITAFKYLMNKRSVTHSDEFWQKLCTGIGLEKGSAIAALRAKLIQDKISKASISSKEKNALIIKAWNHYRKGTKIKYLKLQKDEKFPKII